MCREDSEEARASILGNISGREIFDSGNFSYKQLRFFSEWIIQSDFDHQNFKAFCGTLKEKRDGIAHGEEVLIQNVSDCVAWHDPALELLDALVDTTVDVALNH